MSKAILNNPNCKCACKKRMCKNDNNVCSDNQYLQAEQMQYSTQENNNPACVTEKENNNFNQSINSRYSSMGQNENSNYEPKNKVLLSQEEYGYNENYDQIYHSYKENQKTQNSNAVIDNTFPNLSVCTCNKNCTCMSNSMQQINQNNMYQQNNEEEIVFPLIKKKKILPAIPNTVPREKNENEIINQNTYNESIYQSNYQVYDNNPNAYQNSDFKANTYTNYNYIDQNTTDKMQTTYTCPHYRNLNKENMISVDQLAPANNKNYDEWTNNEQRNKTRSDYNENRRTYRSVTFDQYAQRNLNRQGGLRVQGSNLNVLSNQGDIEQIQMNLNSNHWNNNTKQTTERLQILTEDRPKLTIHPIESLEVISKKEPEPIKLLIPIPDNDIDYPCGLQICGEKPEKENLTPQVLESWNINSEQRKFEVCPENVDNLNISKAYPTLKKTLKFDNLQSQQNGVFCEGRQKPENECKSVSSFDIINLRPLKKLEVEHNDLQVDSEPKAPLCLENATFNIEGEPRSFNDVNQLIKTTKLDLEGESKPSWNDLDEPVKISKMNIEGEVKPDKKVELDVENFAINMLDDTKRFRGGMEIQKQEEAYRGMEKNKNLYLNRKESLLFPADYPKRDWNVITMPMRGRPFSLEKRIKPSLTQDEVEKISLKGIKTKLDWNECVGSKKEVSINLIRKKKQPILTKQKIKPVVLKGKQNDWNKTTKKENDTKLKIEGVKKKAELDVTKEDSVLIEADEVIYNDDYNSVQETFTRPVRAQIQKIEDNQESSTSEELDVLQNITKYNIRMNRPNEDNGNRYMLPGRVIIRTGQIRMIEDNSYPYNREEVKREYKNVYHNEVANGHINKQNDQRYKNFVNNFSNKVKTNPTDNYNNFETNKYNLVSRNNEYHYIYKNNENDMNKNARFIRQQQPERVNNYNNYDENNMHKNTRLIRQEQQQPQENINYNYDENDMNKNTRLIRQEQQQQQQPQENMNYNYNENEINKNSELIPQQQPQEEVNNENEINKNSELVPQQQTQEEVNNENNINKNSELISQQQPQEDINNNNNNENNMNKNPELIPQQQPQEEVNNDNNSNANYSSEPARIEATDDLSYNKNYKAIIVPATNNKTYIKLKMRNNDEEGVDKSKNNTNNQQFQINTDTNANINPSMNMKVNSNVNVNQNNEKNNNLDNKNIISPEQDKKFSQNENQNIEMNANGKSSVDLNVPRKFKFIINVTPNSANQAFSVDNQNIAHDNNQEMITNMNNQNMNNQMMSPNMNNSQTMSPNVDNQNMNQMMSPNMNSQSMENQIMNSQNMENQIMNSQNINSQNTNSQNMNSQNMEIQNINSQNTNSQNMEIQNMNSQNIENQNMNNQMMSQNMNNQMMNPNMNNQNTNQMMSQNMNNQNMNIQMMNQNMNNQNMNQMISPNMNQMMSPNANNQNMNQMISENMNNQNMNIQMMGQNMNNQNMNIQMMSPNMNNQDMYQNMNQEMNQYIQKDINQNQKSQEEIESNNRIEEENEQDNYRLIHDDINQVNRKYNENINQNLNGNFYKDNINSNIKEVEYEVSNPNVNSNINANANDIIVIENTNENENQTFNKMITGTPQPQSPANFYFTTDNTNANANQEAKIVEYNSNINQNPNEMVNEVVYEQNIQNNNENGNENIKENAKVIYATQAGINYNTMINNFGKFARANPSDNFNNFSVNKFNNIIPYSNEVAQKQGVKIKMTQMKEMVAEPRDSNRKYP